MSIRKFKTGFLAFNMILGIGSINCGIMGIILESNKISKFAYSQCEITDFDKLMLSVDYHTKAFLAYSLTFPLFLYGLPFHRERYINLVYKFPLHFILKDRNSE